MANISKAKTGLVLGSLLGIFHLSWALLVASGFAQSFIDWIFRLHFIQPPYTITTFHVGTALGLIAVTFSIGYLLGWLFGAIWNRIYRDSNLS